MFMGFAGDLQGEIGDNSISPCRAAACRSQNSYQYCKLVPTASVVQSPEQTTGSTSIPLGVAFCHGAQMKLQETDPQGASRHRCLKIIRSGSIQMYIQNNRMQVGLFVLAVLLIAFSLGPFIWIESDETRVVFSDLLLPTYNALATAALFYAAWHSRTVSKRLATAWLVIAIGQLSYTFADISWSVIELVLKLDPFPSIADVFYLAFYPLFLIGVLLLPFSSRSCRDRLKVILEIMIVLFSAGLYLWNFIVEPIITQTGSEDFWLLAFTMAYPLFDMLLLLAILVLMFRRSEQVHPVSISLMTVGMLVSIVVDTFFSVLILEGTYETGIFLDFGYPLSNICFGMAGLVQALPKASNDAAVKSTSEQYLPGMHRHFTAAMLVAAFILLVVGYYRDLPFKLSGIEFLGG